MLDCTEWFWLKKILKMSHTYSNVWSDCWICWLITLDLHPMAKQCLKMHFLQIKMLFISTPLLRVTVFSIILIVTMVHLLLSSTTIFMLVSCLSSCCLDTQDPFSQPFSVHLSDARVNHHYSLLFIPISGKWWSSAYFS